MKLGSFKTGFNEEIAAKHQVLIDLKISEYL